MSKETELLALAMKRKGTSWDGYANIGDYHNGAYDCNHVSPWTKSACNFDAKIMLVAQDWAGDEYLSAAFRPEVARLGYDPNLETNINLQKLLKDHLGVQFSDCYATNIFPFVKKGNMSSSIPSKFYREASVNFLIPQIKLVKPKVVICIGAPAFRYTVEGFGFRAPLRISDSIASPVIADGIQLYAVAHTGRLGMNNRGRNVVEQDWENLARQINI